MGRIKNLFSRKENPAERSHFATITPGVPLWTPTNYAALTEAGYQNCATVFACVKLIATTASRIAWVLLDSRGKEIDADPLLDLLSRPNDEENGIRFTEKVFGYLLLQGNTYIARVQGTPSAPPNYLYALRPDRTRIVPGSWQRPVAAYEYTAGATPTTFRADDVLHLAEYAPLDDWYGLSRLQVAARHIDIANEASAWNKSILQNSIIPAGVMNFKTELTEEQRAELKKQIEYRSAGFEKAGKFLLTEGDATWTQMAMTAKDLDFLNGQKFTMRQICAIFGVPSELMGDSENKTYANYQEARRALYEETVLPLMDVYAADLNFWLVPLFDKTKRLTYDRDAIEGLQEERARKYAYLSQADWLTVNEKREACGYEQIAAGNIILVPISDIPLEDSGSQAQAVGGGGNGDGAGQAGKGEIMRLNAKDGTPRTRRAAIKAVKTSFWTTGGRKGKLWAAFEARTRAREKTFKQIQRRYMERQADMVMRKIRTAGALSAIQPRELLDVKTEAIRYRDDFRAWYTDHFIRAGNAGLSATKGEIFDDGEFKALAKAGTGPAKWTFKLTPAREEKLMQMIFNSGTKVNETTIDVIYETLHHAMDENATIEEFTQQIWEQVNWMDPARARLWAETETTKVENWGMVEGYRDSGFIELKGWDCMQLPTSRDEHYEADGQEVPLDGSFEVGGEFLDAPGDPAGSPRNVCNCRCSTYPVVPEG